MSEPRFVVVGHPNKGKSSIVATLARDERVRIGSDPGTTTTSAEYPMRVDEQVLYTLIDTPGFQRARAVLAWMSEQNPSAAKRRAVVQRFVDEPEHLSRFPDEVALLRPIVAEEPTGILYVVDGSKPYGPEYEAEMEILRWSGRPSLALINPIGEAAFVDEWRAALGQYFAIVRVFDAVEAEWAKRLDLLRAFGQMDETWRTPLDEAIKALEEDRRARQQRAASAVAEMIVEAFALKVEKKLKPDSDVQLERGPLQAAHRGKLRELEQQGRDRVEDAYDFAELNRVGPALDLQRLGDDLFSQHTWSRFGLTRAQLTKAGGIAGAILGASIDVGTGFGTFGLGTVAGIAIGLAGGFHGYGKLAKIEVRKIPLGGQLARYGPAKDVNLAFVLLGRARLHHHLVANRTHAHRGDLTVERDADALTWPADTQKTVATITRRLIKGHRDQSKKAPLTRELADCINSVLSSDSGGGLYKPD